MAAGTLASVDETVSPYLIAFNDLLDPSVLATTRDVVDAGVQSIADGWVKQFTLALSAGVLNSPGIADEGDGFSPVASCPPVNLP